MSGREPDDTPKRDDATTAERERRPGDYYYDDATGYEPYDPAADEEDDGESEGGRDPGKP